MNDQDLSEKIDLYDMAPHEIAYIDSGGIKIIRVAGGWIYTIYRLDRGQMNSIFVPHHNEFQ